MLKVGVTSRVLFTCTLSNEDEKKVVDYIKNNSNEFEDMEACEKLRHALEKLHEEDEIDLFANFVESESSVESIGLSEFEHRSAEHILGL